MSDLPRGDPGLNISPAPPSPELQKKIQRSKLRFLSGEPLPSGPSEDLLDFRSLSLISKRPEIYRAHTLLPRKGGPPPAVGKRKALVLLVDFDDLPATTDADSFEDMLFSKGRYPTGSLRDYYHEASYGKLDIEGCVVGGRSGRGWLRAPSRYSYYTDGSYGFGAYPKNAYKLVEDCINVAKGDIDFGEYDVDGDGEVDCLFIVHSGPGAEETGDTNHIWSHMSTIEPISIDGVRIARYSMEPESGRVGVFCHELGHVLGLPDLYDYNFDSAGTGSWDLMASGCWNNQGLTPSHPVGWCKAILGWVRPEGPPAPTITLRPSESYPDIYKLPADGSDKEYFLIENRGKKGFDKYIPGEGLLILHVDEEVKDNNDQSHYLVDIEQCDGRFDLNRNVNDGDEGDAFPSSSLDSFNAETRPSSLTYAGEKSRVSVEEICRSGENITLKIGDARPKAPAWHYDRSISSAYANCGSMWAWAKIEGLGWRRIKESSPQAVTCIFAICCQAAALSRRIDVCADEELIHIIYLS